MHPRKRLGCILDFSGCIPENRGAFSRESGAFLKNRVHFGKAGCISRCRGLLWPFYNSHTLVLRKIKLIPAVIIPQPTTTPITPRPSNGLRIKVSFINCARMVFSSQFSDADVVEEAASRLWRFVNDYAWLPFSPFLFQQRIGYWNSFRVARTHTSNGHNL